MRVDVALSVPDIARTRGWQQPVTFWGFCVGGTRARTHYEWDCNRDCLQANDVALCHVTTPRLHGDHNTTRQRFNHSIELPGSNSPGALPVP
jgi:hypothetical protein